MKITQCNRLHSFNQMQKKLFIHRNLYANNNQQFNFPVICIVIGLFWFSPTEKKMDEKIH